MRTIVLGRHGQGKHRSIDFILPSTLAAFSSIQTPRARWEIGRGRHETIFCRTQSRNVPTAFQGLSALPSRTPVGLRRRVPALRNRTRISWSDGVNGQTRGHYLDEQGKYWPLWQAAAELDVTDLSSSPGRRRPISSRAYDGYPDILGPNLELDGGDGDARASAGSFYAGHKAKHPITLLHAEQPAHHHEEQQRVGRCALTGAVMSLGADRICSRRNYPFDLGTRVSTEPRSGDLERGADP